MAYKTKLQVVTKIERDLDLEEEEFIQPDEMTEYINDAISIIEAHLIKLGLQDHYYLSSTSLNLVDGQADITLPSNIYEGNIKEIVYSNGSTIYRVLPLKETATLEEIQLLNLNASTEYYQYRLRTDSAAGDYVLQLVPTAYETATGVLKMDYYRDAARVSADADLVEVPVVALQYLYQYVKVKVYEKESHANYPSAVAELEKLEALMLATLQGQTSDNENNKIEFDKSFYEDAT